MYKRKISKKVKKNEQVEKNWGKKTLNEKRSNKREKFD